MGKVSDYSYLNRIIDTDALARGIKKGVKYTEGEDLLAYQFKARSIHEKGMKTNLMALGKENKIEFDETTLHQAENDCILNFDVWNKWIKWSVEI